jgi:hypothetical protein
MYEVFDKFLSTDTWHTPHAFDGKRFFQALHAVVSNPGFSPDKMGDYFREKKSVTRGDGHPYEGHIDDLVRQAWAVREYREANGL